MFLRYLFVFISVLVYYLFQVSIFPLFDWVSVCPNLLLAFTICYAYHRGSKTGLFLGAGIGLLLDVMCGNLLGLFAAIYAVLGFLSGLLGHNLNPEDIRYPLLFSCVGDLLLSLLIYVCYYALNGNAPFFNYLTATILPECLLTTLATLLVSPITGWFHQALEKYEKRRAVKFG